MTRLGKISLLIFVFLSSLFSDILPEGREKSVIYYNDFEEESGKARLNLMGIEETLSSSSLTKGFWGRGYLSQEGKSLRLHSPFLSPHNSLTLSVWWALKEAHKPGQGFIIFSLNGKGFISCFVRGGDGDTWCALAKPAGVFQVYSFPGIQNINGIYDFDIMRTLDLRGGVWHNTIVSFSCGREITLYQDGRKVGRWVLTRSLRVDDGINSLSFAPYGEAIVFDEILILPGALDEDEVRRYYQMMKWLKDFLVLLNNS
ncbi:MAG: hypothetical protein ACP5QS_04285 [bacterium]